MKGNKRKGRVPGTWELRVDAGEDPLTRKRQQKSVTFHGTSREADIALAELITKSSRGQVSVGQRTVAHAVEAGLRQAELEGLEPTTLRNYRTSAECHVLPALGSPSAVAPDRRAPRPLLRRAGRGRILPLDRAGLSRPVVPGARPGEAMGLGRGQRRARRASASPAHVEPEAGADRHGKGDDRRSGEGEPDARDTDRARCRHGSAARRAVRTAVAAPRRRRGHAADRGGDRRDERRLREGHQDPPAPDGHAVVVRARLVARPPRS